MDGDQTFGEMGAWLWDGEWKVGTRNEKKKKMKKKTSGLNRVRYPEKYDEVFSSLLYKK